MKLKSWLSIGLLGAALATSTAFAQQLPAQANPTPGCSVTPQQLEANKKVAMDFFRTKRADRVALIDPSYKQHNPVFVKRAADNNETDYEEFKSAFLSPQGDGQRQMAAGSAAPPEGNPFEVVTAECDIVTMIHKTYRPDPTAEGKFYALYSFDTFRVKNGKLTEHWDGSMLPMRRQQQQQPGQPQQ